MKKCKVKDLIALCDMWSNVEGALPKIAVNGMEIINKAVTESRVREEDNVKKIAVLKDDDVRLCLRFLSEKNLQKFLCEKQSEVEYMPRQKKTVERENDVIAIEKGLWTFLLSCEKWDEHKYQLIAALNKGIGKAMAVKNNYASTKQEKENAHTFISYAKALMEWINQMMVPYKIVFWDFFKQEEITRFVNVSSLPFCSEQSLFIGENICSSFYNSRTQSSCYRVSRERFEKAHLTAVRCLEKEIQQIHNWQIKKEREKIINEQILAIDKEIIDFLSKGDIEKKYRGNFDYFFVGWHIDTETEKEAYFRLNFCISHCSETLGFWLLSKNGANGQNGAS